MLDNVIIRALEIFFFSNIDIEINMVKLTEFQFCLLFDLILLEF
jgi:hypothetical protein